MAKYFIVGYFIITEIITILAYFYAKKFNKAYTAKVMQLLVITALLVSVSYLVTLISNNFEVQKVFLSIHISLMGYLGVSLCVYMLSEVSVIKSSDKKFGILYMLATIDSINIMLNLVFGHMIEFTPITNAVDNYISFTGNWFYYIHLAFCIIPIIFGLVMIIKHVIITPRYYRSKYINILVVIGLLVAANIIFVFTSLTIDITVSLYGIASFLLTYLSFNHVPQKLKEALSELLVENSNLAIIYYDIYGNMIISNEFFRTWSKRLNMNYDIIKKFYEDAIVINEKTKEKELVVIYENKKYYFKCQQVHVSYVNRKKEIISLGEVFNAQDNTSLVLANLEKQFKITHDEFTKLYNFSYFSVIGEKMIQSDSDNQYVFIINDIKQFKMFNNIMGMEAGNQVISNIARMLEDKIKDHRVIYCRIVSDRFGILGPKDVIYPLINSDLKISEAIDYNGYKIRNCIGIYEIESRNETVNEMYQKALLALSEAKKDPICNCCKYNKQLVNRNVNEINVINEFSEALENNEFVIYIQPQYEIITKKIVGGEALVRRIKNGKLTPPGDFIPILENTGLISKLDSYVWEKTTELLKELCKSGYKGTLSVNVSAQDIYSMDIPKYFKNLAEKYNIEASRLNVEITETYIVENIRKYSSLIKEMNEYGFEVEMDDFGSGYSSLNTLKSTPVNTLKLDMRFLEDSDNEQRSKVIIKSIIDMAKSLNTQVIAEGVETNEQLEYLRSVSCDYIQGFLLGKPMPINEFKKLLNLESINEK